MVNAPWYPEDKIPFNFYAMYNQAIEDVIAVFVAHPNISDHESVFWEHGINPHKLSRQEIEYIEKEVNRRL